MPDKSLSQNHRHPFLKGGGEMGRLTRLYNWAETPLGEPDRWRQSLRTTLSILLNSKFPMFLFWGPELTCFYNDAYRPSLGNDGKHPSILGMPGESAWPEIWHIIKPLIDQVLAGGEASWNEDQLIPIYRNGKIEDVYWTFSYSPVSDESGKPAGVFVTCSETTDKVLAQHVLQERNDLLQISVEAEKQARKHIEATESDQHLLNEQLTSANDQLILINEELAETQHKLQRMVFDLSISEGRFRYLVQGAPVAISVLTGRELTVESANDMILKIWGKKADIIGKPLAIALPELKGQPYLQLLDKVYTSGKSHFGKDAPATLEYNGKLEERFFDFIYKPLTDDKGITNSIMLVANDVTEQLRARQKIEASEAEQLALNEELASSNEELLATNEELAEAQEKLERLLHALSTSEANFRNMILQAPVAIGLFTGSEMVLETINDKFLELWDKDRSVTGKPLLEALPELTGQPYLQIMQDVLNTGESYYGNESKVFLRRHGVVEEGYYNFINQPARNITGQITGVIVVATEVTEQVKARRDLESAKDTLKLSVTAAELGTFDMDLEKGTLDWDERCRTLFGISHDHDVSYEQDFVRGLHTDDRERILNIIDNEAMIQAVSNGDYDVEYRTVGAEDNKIRWVRAKGKVYFDAAAQPKRFIGTVLDISEQKQDELRKNDFIGMVSHELKTPLTSLSAYIQMLLIKTPKGEDSMTSNALERANVQVKKMGSMINGFLNISRLESGKLILNKQWFEANELLREMIAEISFMTSSHIIDFTPCETLMVKADRDKMGSVISNLLSNAVKYSPKGKHILVSCEETADNVHISIKDEGMGIKSSDLDRLFDRYYRVENKHTVHISGFGIGLYLSAEIVHRHHGKIWAESESGVGSTFHFTLPLKEEIV